MTPDKLIGELAAALNDAIQGTPEAALEQDAEDVYWSLACRLIVRLAPHVALVPKSAVEAPAGNAYEQMSVVSAALVHELARHRHAGYSAEVLATAIVDAYVRLRRSRDATSSTADLLRQLADEAEGMARSEEGTHDEDAPERQH